MAQIFPEWANRIPKAVPVVLLFIGAGAAAFIWYFGSPWHTDVGYMPEQPVPYSHALHAGDLELDCRYCHTGVEVSAVAMVPPTQTCMNCHQLIKPSSEKLAPIRVSWETKRPMEWIKVHKVPDYAYFDHSAHIRAGVGCESCHGDVASMEVVKQTQPLSMGWCLACHKNPDPHLRPSDKITAMNWTPPADQAEFAARARNELRLDPPITCSGCHR